MHNAALHGCMDTVSSLLERGADIEAKINVRSVFVCPHVCISVFQYMSIFILILLFLTGRRAPTLVYCSGGFFFSQLSIATFDLLTLTCDCCRMNGPPCTWPPGMVIRTPSPSYWSRGWISMLRTRYAKLRSIAKRVFLHNLCTTTTPTV